MRIAVEGITTARAGARLARAVAGLARRGHDVRWHGPGRPAGEPEIVTDAGRGHDPADVAIGGGGVARVAHTAWRARAHAMVLALSADGLRRWGWLERWAWDSVWAMALVEESDADAVRESARDLPLDRFVLWAAPAPPEATDVAHADVDLLERACERALARSSGAALRAAAFVDRDGTLIVERGYLSDPEQVELLPGVASALRDVRAAGHPVVVVSNQSGIGRGYFGVAQAHEVNARLRRLLRREGVELDAIHFCPHAPGEGCACRKPGTLLLERAADDLRLSLRSSVMVGDKRLDAETGQAAGMTGILVRTGYGGDEAGAGETAAPPDRVCADLREALAWFTEREEGQPTD